MKPKPDALDNFTTNLNKLVADGLNSGVPPEFVVMRLAMSEHEVANFAIAIKRQEQEAIQAQELTGIIAPNGEQVKSNRN